MTSLHELLFEQVETLSVDETVKIPIAVLKVGESRVVQPELEFPYGPVTFTLVEGNGPVYIHGQQAPNGYEDQVMESGEEFDSEDEVVSTNKTKKPYDQFPMIVTIRFLFRSFHFRSKKRSLKKRMMICHRQKGKKWSATKQTRRIKPIV